MTWLTWFFIVVDVILVFVLVQALRTGVIMAHKGPDVSREKNPKSFWVVFVSYTLVLATALFATFSW